MSSIPEDLYREILIRLPVRSIIKCKCVCKSWFSLISNPNFVKKHFDFTVQNNSRRSILFSGSHAIYSVGYDSFQSSILSGTKDYYGDDFETIDNPFKSLRLSIGLVGSSCNGLVCLRFYEYYEKDIRFYGIWNPATREFKKIPVPPKIYGSIRIYAFGYDSQNDDYKLLTLSATHSSVFTLGLNRWKSIPVAPYDWWTYSKCNGVLVNGKHHWLIRSDNSMKIVSLDISNEKFEVMQLPIQKQGTDQNMIPGALDGCLCLLIESHILADKVFDLWVMQDYGVSESWTRRRTITNERITKGIFTYAINIMGNFKNGSCKLLLYELNHGGASKTNFISGGITSADTYSESLISLDTGTYMGRGKAENNQLKQEEANKLGISASAMFKYLNFN